MSTRLIIIIAILAASFIFGFTLTWPKYQDFQQVRLKQEQKKAELNSKTAYYSKIKDAWEKLDAYNDALKKIDSAIPQNYSIPALFNYLQQTAGETGLMIKNLTPGGVIEGKIKEISFTLNAFGNYSSLKNFFAAIESSERLFKVKNIRLSSSENEEDFSFNLEISAYSY